MLPPGGQARRRHCGRRRPARQDGEGDNSACDYGLQRRARQDADRNASLRIELVLALGAAASERSLFLAEADVEHVGSPTLRRATWGPDSCLQMWLVSAMRAAGALVMPLFSGVSRHEAGPVGPGPAKNMSVLDLP